jgi:hypothetical protein
MFFFYLDYEAIGTAATPGLCQPRVIMKMIVESMMECRLAGETEVLGENLPQRFCPPQNPTCPPGFELGPPELWRGPALHVTKKTVFQYINIGQCRNTSRRTQMYVNKSNT